MCPVNTSVLGSSRCSNRVIQGMAVYKHDEWPTGGNGKDDGDEEEEQEKGSADFPAS